MEVWGRCFSWRSSAQFTLLVSLLWPKRVHCAWCLTFLLEVSNYKLPLGGIRSVVSPFSANFEWCSKLSAMSFLLLQSSFGIELLINFNVSSVVEAVLSKNLVLLWLHPWILSSHLLCCNKKERDKPSQVSVTKCPRVVIHKWSQNGRVEEMNSGHKNPLLQLLLLVSYRVKPSWPSKVITTR